MKNFNIKDLVSGDNLDHPIVVCHKMERVPFLGDRPQLPIDQSTKECSLGKFSENLYFETFIKIIGFFQR